MVEIDGKVYRNLQEQVQKNKEDIEKIYELNTFDMAEKTFVKDVSQEVEGIYKAVKDGCRIFKRVNLQYIVGVTLPFVSLSANAIMYGENESFVFISGFEYDGATYRIWFEITEEDMVTFKAQFI